MPGRPPSAVHSQAIGGEAVPGTPRAKEGITMKYSAHFPTPDWFRHKPASPPPRFRRANDANVSGISPVVKHPLVAIGLALTGSILAGTVWTAFMLWVAPR